MSKADYQQQKVHDAPSETSSSDKADDQQRLKASRSGYKRHVTRLHNELESLINDYTRVDTVIVKNAALENIWTKFCLAHEKYHAELSNKSDIEASIKYFSDAESDHKRTIDSIALYLMDATEDEVNPGPSDVEDVQSQASAKSVKKRHLQIEIAMLKDQNEIEDRRLKIKRKAEDDMRRLQREETALKLKCEIEQAEATEEFLPRRASLQPRYAFPKGEITEKSTTINPIVQQCSSETPVKSEDISNIMQALSTLTLPSSQVPTFGGDAFEYTNFIKAFENLIEKKTLDNSSRLYYLVQYTTGDVKELARSCLFMDPEEGYCEAKRLLKKTYGQNYKIATAYIDKITKAPPIKKEDGGALRKLSVQLISCSNTLKEIGYMSKIENADTLRKIVLRLPYESRKRWRSKADIISESEDREITLDDIVQFVQREARILTHPVFGDISDEKTETDRRSYQNKSKSGSNFATQLATTNSVPWSPRQINCIICKQNHQVKDCPEFKIKPLQDRLDLIKAKGICYNCLLPGHRVKDCRKRERCEVCQRKHSTLIHSYSRDSDRSTNTHEVTNGFIETLPDTAAAIGLSVIPVVVRVNQNKSSVLTYAFLDNGSNASFCTEELLEQLNIRGKRLKYSLTTIAQEASDANGQVVDLDISNLDESVCFHLPIVFSVPRLPLSTNDIPKQEDVERWPHLKGVNLPSINAKVGLLIGSDNIRATEPTKIIRSKDGGPYAVKTPLGWALNGPLGRYQSKLHVSSNFIKTDVELSQQFESFCNREFNDSISCTNTEPSQQDKKMIAVMENSCRLINGHYETAMPWKNEPPQLPNSKSMAERRLEMLKRRLQRDSKLHYRYCQVMDGILQKYAEVVPINMLNRDDGGVWYLPHHPVINPQKPEKLRVVFDCSAKYHGVSLNDELLQGPDLTNSLVGVLTRFREEPIAVTSDIEAMFHQVAVRLKDRDVLRFIWWPDGMLEEAPQMYRMKAHIFGAVSSPSCCNYALKKTATDNLHYFKTEVTDTVQRNFYVDDCLKSYINEEQAIQQSEQLRQLLSRGGFHLTKWSSNSRRVLESIPVPERAEKAKTLDFDVMPVEKALGMEWNTDTDELKFRTAVKEGSLTRRGLLSVVSSLYDPLGFASPYLLHAKMLLQDLCKRKLGWDDEIPQAQQMRWRKWLVDLPKLETFRAPRCVKPSDFGEVVASELHHFSDASESGYGSVTYLRQVNDNQEVCCTLLISKSRVTPLKTITIPRLELAAAAVSARLDSMMRRELTIPINNSFFWTDSMTVLSYITSDDKRYRTYVANRVAIIREISKPTQWRYVDTKSNPADDLSRGLSAEDLLGSPHWLTGPEFLQRPDNEWPSYRTSPVADEELEIKPEKKSCAVVATVKDDDDLIVRAANHFSSWYKLRKCIAWLCRYKQKLKTAAKLRARGRTPSYNAADVENLSPKELDDAETEILKDVQRRHFPEDLKSLIETNIVKKTSTFAKLDPLLMDGLIRVGGRLAQSALPMNSIHQIILPKNDHVTRLIINHFHRQSGHSGREYVLSLTRTKYWIISGNATVRKSLSRCFDCRRRHGPTAEQKMSNLPEDRVSPEKPAFTKVGVDFFGPFMVKLGRSRQKRYGCIFTCLATRAVHIEITYSLDTDSFINALRRFIARRGVPEKIRSDNGGNFVGGNKELKDAIAEWNRNAIHDFLLQRSIEWSFNPPLASHQGGVWERLIRSVRRILGALLSEQTVNDETLVTLMCEVESTMNGRPITRVSNDPTDMRALTPNHLLLLKAGGSLPPGLFEKKDMHVRRRWKQAQYLADQFWRRWTREYLPLLQQRQKWLKPSRNMCSGDLVLLVDQNVPRGHWPMGIVQDTFPDKTGVVRRVIVKTSTGTLQRDVRKICLLENSERDEFGL